MKISLNWLNQFINLDPYSSQEISKKLTDIGLEVEAEHQFESVKGGLEGIVIGEVISCVKHPNADKLKLTSVNIGLDLPLSIVCGAPNISVSQKVAVATVGTVLYHGDDSFKIKKSKIRGEVSEGMICSEYELGVGSNNDGIMVLDSDTKVGLFGSDCFNCEKDIVFDIGLTPNRSDAMSHLGVARDLQAVINKENSTSHTICIPQVEDFKIEETKKMIDVKVSDSNLCPRYSGLTISDVVISESPNWIKSKLASIGITPINNVVDITNYVLHELGQPLHAFDLAKIKGNTIEVKQLDDKTEFITLDNISRQLSKDDLMICSKEDPMCIAGVFGGINSGVTNKTVDIFLESAYFNPVSVRKTAKTHGLNTDASFRYERGCDPGITIYALKRAALMIQEVAGGVVSSEIIDIYPKKISNSIVNLRYKKLQDVVGEIIDQEVVKSILKDLEIVVMSSDKDSLDLRIPLYRVDVTREIDVIEEILRIYGFNSIKMIESMTLPFNSNKSYDFRDLTNVVSDLLTSNGFFEIINNSIDSSKNIDLVKEFDENKNVKIINSLTHDLDIMRQSMLFGGLKSISYNLNRKNSDVKMFEFGKVYKDHDQKYIEDQRLSLFICGNISSENWRVSNESVNFYYLKQRVNMILQRLGILNYEMSELNSCGFVNGLEYRIRNEVLVSFGKIDNGMTNGFNIKNDVYYADFNWDLVTKFHINIKYAPVSRFPSVRRDLSMLVDRSVTFHRLESIAKKCVKNSLLTSVSLFDVYEGDKIPEDKKSYAISFIFSDSSKTLTDKIIEKMIGNIISAYIDIGAVIRKD